MAKLKESNAQLEQTVKRLEDELNQARSKQAADASDAAAAAAASKAAATSAGADMSKLVVELSMRINDLNEVGELKVNVLESALIGSTRFKANYTVVSYSIICFHLLRS